MRTLVALLAASSFAASPALATTLFANPPWIVTFDELVQGEPTCSISVLSPEGYGVSVEQRAAEVTVNILDMDKNYAITQSPMWVAVGGDTFEWDATLMGNIAMTTQKANNRAVNGLLDAFSERSEVEIGTKSAPPAVFIAPPSGKASTIFDLCRDLL